MRISGKKTLFQVVVAPLDDERPGRVVVMSGRRESGLDDAVAHRVTNKIREAF